MNPRKTTWIWVVLGVVLSLMVVGMIAAGGIAHYVFRQTSIQTTSPAKAADRFEQARARFKDRRPYIEFQMPGRLKVHHELEQPQEAELHTVRILVWDDDDHRLVETSIPFWLVRLKASSAFNVRIGRISRDLEVTAQDLARFGPGLIIDFEEEGGARVLVWTE